MKYNYFILLVAAHLYAMNMDPLTEAAQNFPGVIGVAAMNLGTSRLITYNGEQFFPMGGSCIVPMAAYALSNDHTSLFEAHATQQNVDNAGNLVEAEELRSMSYFDWLAEAFNGDSLALQISMDYCGGPAALDGWCASNKISGVNFGHGYLDWLQGHAAQTRTVTSEAYEAYSNAEGVAWYSRAAASVGNRIPNIRSLNVDSEFLRATPIGMLNLLVGAYQGTLPNFSEASRGCFRSLLPTEQDPNGLTSVMHVASKGLCGFYNEAAILLREGKSPMALSISLKNYTISHEEARRTMGALMQACCEDLEPPLVAWQDPSENIEA